MKIEAFSCRFLQLQVPELSIRPVDNTVMSTHCIGIFIYQRRSGWGRWLMAPLSLTFRLGRSMHGIFFFFFFFKILIASMDCCMM